jgi:CHAT domain-containing protein/tetratricopeptide (TPR) repeat protein
MDKVPPSIPESTKIQVAYLFVKGEEMRDMKKIDDAMKYYNNAREINKQVGDKYMNAFILLNLSLCYRDTYQYENAIKTAEDSIAISSQLQGEKRKNAQLLIGDGYVSLGHTFNMLGKYDKAIECQEKGIEALLKYGVKNALGIAYGNMGATYRSLEKYEKAMGLFQEALKISRTTGDKSMEASNLHNIALVYLSMNEVQRAIDHFEDSARIFTEIGKMMEVSSSHAVLSSAYSFLEKKDISESYWKSSIEKFIAVVGDDISETVMVELGDVFYFSTQRVLRAAIVKLAQGSDDAKQSLETCVRVLKKAIESTDKILLQLTVDSNRTAFSDKFYVWYKHLIDPLLLLERVTAALLILDLGRAKILRCLLYRQVKIQDEEKRKSSFELSWMTIENGGEEERISTLAREIQLLESHATILVYNFSDRTGALIFLVLEPNGCVSYIGGKTTHDELEDDIRKLLENASVEFPRGYSFLEQSKVSDVEDISTKEFTLRKLSSEQKTEEETSHQQKETRIKECKSEYRSPARRADETCNNLSKDGRLFLYKALIDPVKSLIKGTKLIIVPESCLFFAPFSSFIDENGNNLSENYEIQIIPSIHVLASSIQASGSKGIAGSLFVGNPKVENVHLLPLLSAAEEVEYLASLLDGKPLTGRKATKSNVMDLMPDASIIHIAAHAHEESGHIFLAPELGKQNDDAHTTSPSDLLTQSDVLELKLSARLVVLSCCHTGMGKLSSEGVLGIARSFLGAGASSILVTLWKINDDFTKKFMTAFYQKICEEKSVCLALKETMNVFQRNGQYTSFVFWAAFEILGEDVRFTNSEIEEIRRKNKEKTVSNS